MSSFQSTIGATTIATTSLRSKLIGLGDTTIDNSRHSTATDYNDGSKADNKITDKRVAKISPPPVVPQPADNHNRKFQNPPISKTTPKTTGVSPSSSTTLPKRSLVNQRRMLLGNPQSLLARDPNELSQLLSISMADVTTIRNQVSNTILMDPIVGHGIESRRIIDDLGLLLDENDENDEDGNDSQFRRKSISKRRNYPSMVGGTTALDECLHYNASTSSQPSLVANNSIISSGSMALDTLLSPPSRTPSSSYHTNTSSITNTNMKRSRSQISTSNKNTYSNNNSNSNTPTIQQQQQFGLQSGIVTEVSGPSGSGKTQLALSLAANAILQTNNNTNTNTASSPWKVHYLAAGSGSTSLYSLARRFRQLCHSRLVYADDGGGDSGGGGVRRSRDPRASDDLLNRISFEVVKDGYTLLATLSRLEREFDTVDSTTRSNGSGDKFVVTPPSNNLIILDSASGCLSPYLYGDGDGGAGAALMNEVSLSLRRLARQKVWVGGGGKSKSSLEGSSTDRTKISLPLYCCQNAVFVTNGVVSAHTRGGGGVRGGAITRRRQYKPALGESWRVSDIHLLFSDVYDDISSTSLNVSGMRKSIMRHVSAQLNRHYAKKCDRLVGEDETVVHFGIDISGIVDGKPL